MITIEKYVSSLLPNFESKRIHDSIQRISDEYEETVIPVYHSTTEAFKATMFSVPENKEFSKIAKANLPTYKGSVHESIYRIVQKAPAKMKILSKLVDEHYSKHVTAEGMTYAKVNVLQMVEVMDFTAMYARRLLLTMYSIEATPFDEKIKERAFLREVNWLRRGAQAFYKCLTLVDMKPSDFEQKFKHAQDIVVVPGETEQQAAVIGPAKLDPLATGLIPYRWNPAYHLGVVFANWQHSRYEQAKAEKETVELQLLYLKADREDGKKNPKLAKKIEHNESRLDKLRKTINDMEEDAADE